VTELPQTVVFRQFGFGRERRPVDEAAHREAGAVEPLALPEAGHIEHLRIGLSQPGQHRRPASPGRERGEGHLDVARAAPGPFKIQQGHDAPVADQDVRWGSVAVQHHVRVPADRDPPGDLGQPRRDRVQDVLVGEWCGAGVLDEPGEMAHGKRRQGARRDGDRVGLRFRALGRGVPGQHPRGRLPGVQVPHDLGQLPHIRPQHGTRFAAPGLPQRSGAYALDQDPAYQLVPAVIQDGRAGHAIRQHGQQLRLPHQAVHVAPVTDLQHRLGGHEPRIVRSALQEHLIAGQPQPCQLRDLDQAAVDDRLIPGPARYPVDERHHPAGQIVRAREPRDQVRVHHNCQARTD
jgi:hypothetical protein